MTRNVQRILGVSLLAVVGCAPKFTDYSNYLQYFPKSVLVLPPINESLEVQASGMFLSTVTTFLAERGYYVLPVAVVDAVLKENGVPLPPEMHQISLSKLGEVFGADAVLYVTVKQWTTTYVVIDATTTVTLSYRLVDIDSAEELWRWQQAFQYSPSSQQSSLIGMVIVAAVHAADSTTGRVERNVAAAANQAAFNTPRHGVLTGPRHPNYEKDLEITKERQQELEERRQEKAPKQ
jgi:hypothetical protein